MKIPIITGPTAAGKTAVVLGFAEKHNIEIISADAYQVYKHMNIGTAKPEEDELRMAPHHLIDILSPDQTYSAGIFFEQAQRCIGEVLARGNIPVVAGGTGMYVETLQKGIFGGPERDISIRKELESRMEAEGTERVHAELAQVDPEFASAIKPTDPTRILRGMEINIQLGMNVREAQVRYHQHPQFEYDIYVLTEDRQKIYDRINMRVDVMFDRGWEQEVKSLLEMGYDETLDSFKAIGYREVARCIREGISTESVAEKIKTNTRNFAKRQLTWFRRMKDINYVDLADENSVKKLDTLIFT